MNYGAVFDDIFRSQPDIVAFGTVGNSDSFNIERTILGRVGLGEVSNDIRSELLNELRPSINKDIYGWS